MPTSEPTLDDQDILDPILKGLLDQLEADPAPKLWDEPPARARERYRALTLMLERPDLPIGRIEQASMPGPGGEIALRIYTPVGAGRETLPGIVYFHGGGWVFGDLDTHDALCRDLANQSGARLVSVDYRLAPESRFPAAADDCFAAVRWVAANAHKLAIDPARIAVAGDSAGGNLAAVACLMARAEGGPAIRHQLLIYPVTQWKAGTASMSRFAVGYFLEKAGMDVFHDQYAPGIDLYDWRVSPLSVPDLSGLPAVTVLTAGFDPLKDEGSIYAGRLAAAGVVAAHHTYPTMIHGFVTMAGAVPTARQAIADAASALREAFRS